MSLKDHARRLLQARAEKIERLNRRDSNVTMNLIKAYCIIYIVSVHIWETAIDFPLSNWVIHSHIMALFAFVSGYFYKPSADEIPWGVFLMQKVRALLVPYFIWNLVYLTITTLLNAFTPLRYGDSLSLNALFIRPWTDSMHCAFMAPAWYIPAFFLSMVYRDGDRIRPNPYIAISRAAFAEVKSLAAEFGLTPANRTAIIANALTAEKTRKELDPLEQILTSTNLDDVIVVEEVNADEEN